MHRGKKAYFDHLIGLADALGRAAIVRECGDGGMLTPIAFACVMSRTSRRRGFLKIGHL
jgi:hypothetical protein